MSDYILFVILFLILLILFNIPSNNKNILVKNKNIKRSERFNNTDTPIYHRYILTDDNSIKYVLLTFSQLNFDLQKKILNKLTNTVENFEVNTNSIFNNIFGNNSTSSVNTPIVDTNSIFNNIFGNNSTSSVDTPIVDTNNNTSSVDTPSVDTNNSTSSVNTPSVDTNNSTSSVNFSSSNQPEISNVYKKLFDVDMIKALITDGSKYYPANDIVFAVRLNRLADPNIISYNQELLFDENKVINYSLMNYQMIKPSNALLSICDNILTVSLPDNSFNIKMQNEFKKAVIDNNQIGFKNIELSQLEENSPVYLINLTDSQSNINIKEEKVKI